MKKKLKNYKKVLDSNIVSEREPEIKIVNIPTYVSDVDEYLSNRYPTYDVISIEDRTAKIQEKESYVPKKIVFGNGGQFYRRISHGRPTINLELLKNNYPDAYESVIKMIPEIDEEKLNEKLSNDPEFLMIIEEVLQMSRPSVAYVTTKPTEE